MTANLWTEGGDRGKLDRTRLGEVTLSLLASVHQNRAKGGIEGFARFCPLVGAETGAEDSITI